MTFRRGVMCPAVDRKMVAAGARYLVLIWYKRHSTFAELRQKVFGDRELELKIEDLRIVRGFPVEANIESGALLMLPNFEAANQPIQSRMRELLRIDDGIGRLFDLYRAHGDRGYLLKQAPLQIVSRTCVLCCAQDVELL